MNLDCEHIHQMSIVDLNAFDTGDHDHKGAATFAASAKLKFVLQRMIMNLNAPHSDI